MLSCIWTNPDSFFSSLISLIGTIFVVLSLCEIAAIYPTAGGKNSSLCSPLAPIAHWINIRTISLGPLSHSGIISCHSIMVYRLDIYRWPTCPRRFSSLCRRATATGSHYPQQPRHIYWDTMAGDALLLVNLRVLHGGQYLWLQDSTSYQHHCWLVEKH